MNIFVLDEDPAVSARYHYDKHVVKVLTEAAQLLSNAYYYAGQNSKAPYSPASINTQLAQWVCYSVENWEWTLRYGQALYVEYQLRYGNKIHVGGEAILKMSLDPPELKHRGRTNWHRNMPEEYKLHDVVSSYRNYYANGKYRLLSYTGRDIPDWIEEYRKEE